MDGSDELRAVEISLSEKYPLSERAAVFAAFKALVNRLRDESNLTISDRRIGVVMDDVFASKDVLVSIDGQAPRLRVFAGLVHPRTISNALKREMNIGLLDVHLDTLHVLHAFVQIMDKAPPCYLR